MKQKVVILGAGVGGLAYAHELSKNPNYEIHIYERNDRIGGLARSALNSWQKHSEVCWKAISSGYKYFLNILDEIIDEKGIKVISHLRPLSKFIYAFDEKNYIEYDNSFITDINMMLNGFERMYEQPITFLDKLKLFWIYLRANTICDQRLEQYDSFKWAEYIGNVSPELKRWILDSTSIYLGMDYSKLSTYFIFHMIRNKSKSSLLDSSHVFYALDGPMSEILFDPWQQYLENKGVHFHLNHRIASIVYSPEQIIKSIHIECDEWYREVSGDIFVNALSVDQLAKLLPMVSNTLLADNSHQIQTQVLYYLPNRLQPIGTDPTIIILPDTLWFLMARIEGDLWGTSTDYLSTGIGMWDIPGICGKTAIECNREELANECWMQICNSKHNLKLPTEMPNWDIWFSFQFNEVKNQLDTYEPKFSNNINTLKHRPEFKDKNIKNMYNATSYTKTYMDIFNMESGVEAGVKAAQLTQGKEVFNDEKKPNWFFRLCRWFDRFFFKLFEC
jgi:hypothetical protein